MILKPNTLAKAIIGGFLSLFLLMSTTQAAESTGGYAVGFQSSGVSSGLSGKMEISDEITAQAVLGFFGAVSNYSVRGLYKFNSDEHWDAYGFGSLGMWTWDGSGGFDDETVFGLGAGVGIEYDWRALAPTLPPVYWNLELGFNIASFDNYDFSSVGIGVGAHYRF